MQLDKLNACVGLSSRHAHHTQCLARKLQPTSERLRRRYRSCETACGIVRLLQAPDSASCGVVYWCGHYVGSFEWFGTRDTTSRSACRNM